MPSLRTETTNYTFRKACKELGDRCANCGSDDHVEYHHIVPLCAGGTNNITNIVPLCRKCHLAAHSALPRKGHAGKGGRPRKKLPDNYLDIFNDYINAVIGSKEFCRRLNTGKHVCEVEEFKKYLEEKGIVRVRSNVDYYDRLHRGDRCTHVWYADGTMKRIVCETAGE